MTNEGRLADGTFAPGNQIARKLTTDELKQEAYRQYCAHLAKGLIKDNWYFEHEDLSICYETMESYIKNEPSVFKPIQKKIGWAKGYQYWEAEVGKAALGENSKADIAGLQMIMRNKYKWDAKETSSSALTQEELCAAIRQIASEPRISASERSKMENGQSLLDQGCTGKSDQIHDELGTKSSLERSSSLQDNPESPSAGHNDVFLPPFP